MWLVSPRTVVASLVAGHDAPASAVGTARTVNVPGISVTVREMIDAVARVAGPAVAARIEVAPDPAIERIVRTWPRDFDAKLGRSLGMGADESFDAIVRQYMDHDMPR
jgi:nucleoside-diphosphate-sugar epimerase